MVDVVPAVVAEVAAEPVDVPAALVPAVPVVVSGGETDKVVVASPVVSVNSQAVSYTHL